MRMRRYSLVGCLLTVAFLVVAAGGATASAEVVKMSYNGPADVENNAVHYFATNFKKLVEEGTGGAVEIELYPDSQLGNEEERMELLMDTGMNQPIVNIASYAGIAPVFPEMYASNIPFLFDSFEAAHIYFDQSRFWDRARKVFRERTGAVLLAAVEEGGFLAFTNSKRPIHEPADFKGLKFRAMADDQVALYEAFGASGTPIPWTELYMALKTGVVDGQMNPAMYIRIGSLYEVQTYLTLANIQYSDQFLVMNGKLFDSLSEKQRQVVRDAALEANNMNRAFVEKKDSKDIEFLVDQGMEAYTPTDEQMARFRDIGQPAYLEWLQGRIDESWIDLSLECAAGANKKAAEQ
ncbi:MAG: TRAP transporter substrate-binding protein DctP [Synergistales bacterium]|nr:TRAP transporter substrate-binding protein DctP [Synergistales bacterium]